MTSGIRSVTFLAKRLRATFDEERCLTRSRSGPAMNRRCTQLTREMAGRKEEIKMGFECDSFHQPWGKPLFLIFGRWSLHRPLHQRPSGGFSRHPKRASHESRCNSPLLVQADFRAGMRSYSEYRQKLGRPQSLPLPRRDSERTASPVAHLR